MRIWVLKLEVNMVVADFQGLVIRVTFIGLAKVVILSAILIVEFIVSIQNPHKSRLFLRSLEQLEVQKPRPEKHEQIRHGFSAEIAAENRQQRVDRFRR